MPCAVWLAGTVLACELLLPRLPDSMEKPVSGGCRAQHHSGAHTAQPSHVTAAKFMRNNHPLRSLPRAPLLLSPFLGTLSPAAPRFWGTAAQSGILHDYSRETENTTMFSCFWDLVHQEISLGTKRRIQTDETGKHRMATSYLYTNVPELSSDV